MPLIIRPTNQIVELDGVPARVWDGELPSGARVTAFITRLMSEDDTGAPELAAVLRETRTPSVAWPRRMRL